MIGIGLVLIIVSTILCVVIFWIGNEGHNDLSQDSLVGCGVIFSVGTIILAETIVGPVAHTSGPIITGLTEVFLLCILPLVPFYMFGWFVGHHLRKKTPNDPEGD
ncbi:hypothetical protein HXA34_20115 [Salipaludibacillus agaradhaerens]|uniref:hypothetical protein n=1 Tax=Salipaludibacillus agaradhaerens TaxID=76935 RepID=UPI002151F23A|nr:hypothetical protein [Salipaludibacillus agaradhaerens]MCR6120626.1 hypothetical protein [Salipaludibacillus agaradhaerens]